MDLNKIFITSFKGKRTLEQYIGNLNLMYPYPLQQFQIDMKTHIDKETLIKYKDEISKRLKVCNL